MKKSKPNPRKINIVANLQSKLDKAKAIFLTDYKGLTHQQLEDLRKSLKTVQAEFMVVKNTLLKKSLENAKKVPPQRDPASGGKNEDLIKMLKDTTAAFFAYGDELTAIKKLADFAKNFTLPKVKIGLWNNKIITPDDFNRLASLPTKEVLLSTLVYRLKSPISLFHYALSWNLVKFVTVLDNVKSKKSN